MPITGIDWKDNEGYDIHLLRGNHRLDLRSGLEFDLPDGSTSDATTYLGSHADVELDFRPSFTATLDFSTTPALYVGFGIQVNSETGQIEVDPPPLPDPQIHNFILSITAHDTSDDKRYTTSIRVHLHNRVTSAWLTPPILTLRPSGAALPETTTIRFSVKAQFDDNTIGDITYHPNIIWRPSANVAAQGFLKIDTGNTPATPAVEIQAVLPPDLEDFLNPSPPEITAIGHIRFAANWDAESTIHAQSVQIQDTWPGTINPELVPNFLFLCDGYKAEDQPRFESQVRSFLDLMKKSKIARPFDILSTSMNYFQAFMPSAHHGISVLCEIYPNQDSDGNIQTEGDGTVKLRAVPNPTKAPSDGNWGLANVIYELGLPVPSQAGLTISQVRDYWDSIVTGIDRSKISDDTVQRWKKLAKRTFVEETDSTFGLAYGDRPISSDESDNSKIGFHPRRMTRGRMDPMLRRLTDAQGNSMETIWAGRADGTRPNSYPLIFIFSSLLWDRGVNYGRGYIAMNVEDRAWFPARPVSGKPTYEIDLTGHIRAEISNDRLIRGCHEVGHSFGLGDEYNERGELPQSRDIDSSYGNLQKHSDIEDPATHQINGDQIKWRWHRIRKAGVIASAITEPSSGRFRIPLILGQANQFAVGNTVLLRVRSYPDPLPRNPQTSGHLEVLEVSDFTDQPGSSSPEAYVIVGPKTGHTFTSSDAANFPEGCIVYLPVRAKDSVFNESTYPFSELIAKNIKDHITTRNRALNVDPDDADVCEHDPNDVQEPVKLNVDLPFCYKNKNRIVGLFTGGATYDCGVYHPTGSCIMRNCNGNGKEFCAVCRYILVDIIDPSKHFTIDLDYEEIYPQT